MIVFISGPQGCGKTRRQKQLLRHFNGKRIVDDWAPGDTRTLQDGDVVLSNFPPKKFIAAKVVATLSMVNVRYYDFLEIKQVLTGGSHGLRK